MATTRSTTTRSRTKTAAAKLAPKPAPEPELDEEEFEEVEADETTDTPTKKKSGAATNVTFGVADLAAHLSEATGKVVTTRELRTLIRKMARDDSGRVNREIVAGNRTRYDWPLGLKDPEVRAIIAAFQAGEGEIEKKAKLQALKDSKAAAKAPAGSAKKTATKKPAAKPPVVEDDEDEDDDEIEFDED